MTSVTNTGMSTGTDALVDASVENSGTVVVPSEGSDEVVERRDRCPTAETAALLGIDLEEDDGVAAEEVCTFTGARKRTDSRCSARFLESFSSFLALLSPHAHPAPSCYFSSLFPDLTLLAVSPFQAASMMTAEEIRELMEFNEDDEGHVTKSNCGVTDESLPLCSLSETELN